MEWFFVILVVIGVAGLIAQHFNKKEEQRQLEEKRASLTAKYLGNPFINDILSGTIRQGMTEQQVIDSWGLPAAREERVLKTKVVHTLKYAQIGSRSFRQQVKLENGVVVGWTNR